MRKMPSRSSTARAARGFKLRWSAIALTGTACSFLMTVALAEDGGAPSSVAGAAVAQAADTAAAPVASTAESGPESIIVTARKRNESLKDIPASVQAVPSILIDEAHMTQLDDLGSVVTNVNLFEAHDNSPAAVMRGIGAFEVYNGVGFFLNDVQLFEGQTVRPNDVERIEVLKGPQGTLYGGSNIGGAIKYVEKDPTRTWQNEVTGEIGNYWARNGRAVVIGMSLEPIRLQLPSVMLGYMNHQILGHDGYVPLEDVVIVSARRLEP